MLQTNPNFSIVTYFVHRLQNIRQSTVTCRRASPSASCVSLDAIPLSYFSHQNSLGTETPSLGIMCTPLYRDEVVVAHFLMAGANLHFSKVIGPRGVITTAEAEQPIIALVFN